MLHQLPTRSGIPFFLAVLLACTCAPNRLHSQKVWLYPTEQALATITNCQTDSQQSAQSCFQLVFGENIGQPVFYSEWLGAYSIVCSPSALAEIIRHPAVAHWEAVAALRSKKHPKKLNSSQENSPMAWTVALTQIESEQLAAKGLDGRGVKIGVIDGGFRGVFSNPALRHLADSQQVIELVDYWINSADLSMAQLSQQQLGSHGTSVLRRIAGLEGDRHYGLATGASFYLARTENSAFESRIEEDYWVAALEWLYSKGVRLVNSSVGYSKGFTNPAQNYLPKQMDGKTAVVSRALEAAWRHGMLVVVSAGNEGLDKSWQIITAPADAPHAISVGAITRSGTKASYSSVGPSHLPYIKPEVVCYSLNGTSFSAPVITGLAACLMQYKPSATVEQIREAILHSGHLYPYPNNFLGYGIPHAGRAMAILNGTDTTYAVESVHASENNLPWFTADLSFGNALILYHKNEFGHLLKIQKKVKLFGKSARIKRKKGATQTSVVWHRNSKEIIWSKNKKH